MFERFDDPEPGGFVPDDRFRAAVDRRARQLRRRRRVAQATTAVAAVVVLVVGAVGLYVLRRDAAIDRVEVATQPSTDGAVNILLLGSDRRPPDHPDGGTGARADTIAILRIDGDGPRVLSIPRDLLDADGQRINGALDRGTDAMVDAVVRTLGVPVDHVVVLDFQGFIDLVDEVGGVELAVHAPVRDERAGLALEPADCTTLDGEAVLSLVRSRHLETFDAASGQWIVDPTGDLGRMSRHQLVLSLIWHRLRQDPATFDALSRILADHAVVDSGLTLGRMVDLGRRLASGSLFGVETVPIVPFTTEAGASVLQLDPTDAPPLLAAFGADNGSQPSTPGEGSPPVGALPFGLCPTID